MGRVVSFASDDKAVDVQREKLLGAVDDAYSPLENQSGFRTKRSSLTTLRDSLPSLQDVVKLLLFCAVTVVGMTFLSQAIPKIGRSTKPQPSRGSQGSMPMDVSMCQSTPHNTSLSLDFTDPTKFAFTQESQRIRQPDHSFHLVHTIGSIEVRNAEKSAGSYVHVDLDIRGSNAQLISSDALGIAKTDSSLTVTTPKQLPNGMVLDRGMKMSCIQVSAIITISPGARLEDFGIDSETLSVIFRPGLDYAESRVVETKTQFDSVSTYSRETIINVISASVTGSFPLYDLLSIHTNSGSIHADIVPHNASRENVKPAVLRLSSNSGSVRSRTSTTSVPDRDYQTSISTSSGSIEAGILHGLRTSLRSINGRVTADLYPCGHNDSRTDIEAHSTSGGMDVTLHSSISHPTAPLKELYGYYRGVSGSLTIFYPAQWQGTVVGTTLSGGVDIDWQGLKIVKDGKEGYVKRTIEAVRGEGEGRLEFHETSGSFRLGGESGGV